MPIPSSGAVSFNDIQTEFGGTNPISLSEYYSIAANVPASGTIKVSDFYGQSAGPTTFPQILDSAWNFGTGSLRVDLTDIGTTPEINDILVVFCETANQTITISNVTNAIWNSLPNLPTPGSGTAGLALSLRLTGWWARLATQQDIDDVWWQLSDSGDHQTSLWFLVRGAKSSGDPWDVGANGMQTSASTSVLWRDITTLGPKRLIINALAGDRDINSAGDVSSYANANLANVTIVNQEWSSTGTGGGIFIGSGEKDSAGASGNSSATITSQIFHHWTGALIGS